jgi:hypothetical protein
MKQPIYYISYQIRRVRSGYEVLKAYEDKYSIPVDYELVGKYDTFRQAFETSFKLNVIDYKQNKRSSAIITLNCDDDYDTLIKENKVKKIRYQFNA